MNELAIQEQSMTSREIAEMYGKPHSDVLKKMRKLEKAYVEAFGDEGNFSLVDYSDSKGELRPEFHLNKSQALFVASRFDAVLHAKVQKRWEDLENANQDPVAKLVAAPKSEILLLAANQAVTIEKQDEQLQLQAPKVLFADSVSTSSSLILIRDLAKILKQNGVEMGGNRLFKWLRENGYLIRQHGTDRNRPTQRSINMGLFKIKETTVTHSSGSVNINVTPKVTGKGQLYFVNKLVKEVTV